MHDCSPLEPCVKPGDDRKSHHTECMTWDAEGSNCYIWQSWAVLEQRRGNMSKSRQVRNFYAEMPFLAVKSTILIAALKQLEPSPCLFLL